MKKKTMKQQTLTERYEAKRGSSFSHISMQIYESASATITAIGCGRLLQADYLSARGKWIHLGKLLTVVFIPILAGWIFTLYSLANNVIQKDETVEAQTLMMRAINLGGLIHKIQKERDMTILYISEIGTGPKAFLLKEYEKTDQAFADMWDWPAEFTDHPKTFFRTKQKLMNHISTHRNKLDLSSDVYEEIIFYSEIEELMMQWMIERIRESGFGNTWKTLVVFQKITRCMLDTGAERAYGSMFFARGNFPSPELYDNYFRRIFRFNYNYRSSTFYSDLVDPLLDTTTDQTNITIAIRALRNEIKNSNFSASYTSKDKAQAYYDNVTFRVDFLFSLQTVISLRIIDRINATVNEYVQNIVIFSILATVVIFSLPVITFFTEALTSTMQDYTRVLSKASDELNKERGKTDSLLYQILPKPIAERLKRKCKVASEFFKSATIMFTSVVSFTQLSIEYSALELVELLNMLYTCIDEKIEKYDVYKVETINDTYMVVSGVPVPNGDRHASEIAYLALDIASTARANAFMSTGIKSPVHLLLGISTGPVSAGVVGTVMLRYCLFGDTVNTASRMRSYGQGKYCIKNDVTYMIHQKVYWIFEVRSETHTSRANRIQVSESTYQHLKRTNSFKISKRGSICIKGKGEMNTYWLIESSRIYERAPGTSTWRLPGQTEADSSGNNQAEQGTSQGGNVA